MITVARKKPGVRPTRDVEFAVAFGRRLREVRERGSHTQTSLAEALGLKPTNIGRIERGERTPGWQFIIEIATVLGVTTDELIPEEGGK